MSESWFRIALADARGTRVVVAPGEQLGEAIAAAQARAARGEAWPLAAELAAAGEVPLGESVGKGVVVEREPLAGLPGFRWPSGVLPTFEGARRLGAPVEGHRRVADVPAGTTAFEAVIAGDRLVDAFLGLVEQLPAADNIEVRVTGHYDAGGATEVWLTPRLGDARRAIRFLDDHDVELLGNGHVEIAVYLRAQRSTLRLTAHKSIVWVTEDDARAGAFPQWLAARGAPAVDDLPMVTSVEHHLWRPVRSRPRGKLIERLQRMRMRRVDQWASPA